LLPPDLASGPAFLPIGLSLLSQTDNTEEDILTPFRKQVRNRLFLTKSGGLIVKNYSKKVRKNAVLWYLIFLPVCNICGRACYAVLNTDAI
jgi:hypothetical protein